MDLERGEGGGCGGTSGTNMAEGVSEQGGEVRRRNMKGGRTMRGAVPGGPMRAIGRARIFMREVEDMMGRVIEVEGEGKG